MILGLPGETGEDVVRTLRLVEKLSERPLVVFPIFYEPIGPKEEYHGKRFTLESMTSEHFRLFTTCYELNFKWVPRLYWDNQRAGGVGLFRRLCVQALGRAEIYRWRRNFKKIAEAIQEKEALKRSISLGKNQRKRAFTKKVEFQ